jgi:hypothetical protein
MTDGGRERANSERDSTVGFAVLELEEANAPAQIACVYPVSISPS